MSFKLIYFILDYASIEANATLNINYVTSPILSDDPAALVTMYVSINIRNNNVSKKGIMLRRKIVWKR